MFKFPYTNLHELNLDWILEKVKTLVANNDEFNEKADYAVETADEAKEIAEQAAQAQIADGSVTTAKLADYAVTQVKLAVNAVGNYQLQDASVTTSKLYDEAVTTAKLADEAVTYAKLAPDAKNQATNWLLSTPEQYKIGNGYTNITALAGQTTTGTATLPVEYSSTDYGVSLTANTSNPENFSLSLVSRTTTTFTFAVYNNTATDITLNIMWFAIGK